MTEKKSVPEPISVWDKVSNSFGKIGPNYWAWFGEELVKRSTICSGHLIVDIGCGRGASLFPAARCVGPNGNVIGIDTSAGMISSTQNEVDEKRLNNVSLAWTNIIDFSYESNSIDGIFCGFGIGFLEADKESYNKVKMLLRDTGIFGISSWTHQKDQSWMTELVNKYLEIETGSVSESNRETRDMTTEEGIKDILAIAGFDQIRTEKIKHVFVFKDTEEWWQDLNNNAVRNIIDAIDEKGVLAEFKAEAFERINQYRYKDGIYIEREAILAYCMK